MSKVRNLLGCIIIILVLLSICVSVDYAEDTIDTCNGTVVNNKSVIGVNENDTVIVVKSDDLIHSDEPRITITAKPSVRSNYQYRWYTMSWVNYCPICHHYGTLHNAHKWQARYEQELTCSHCDSDFCGVTGKNKYSWSYVYLIRA